MITGLLPFDDPNTTKLYKKIIKGDYSIPDFVSSSGKDLIRSLLITSPDKRITLPQIKNHE